MKSLRKATAPLLVGGLAVALVLSACSGQGSPAPSGSGDAGGVTDISWWAYGPEQSVVDQYLAAFNKEHPDIHVTFKLIAQDSYDAALRPALSSDAGPDVFTEDPGARFEQFQHFGVDLTDSMVAALGEDWASQLSVTSVSGFTVDGKLMAGPVGGDFGGTLWINKDLFDAQGLEPPTTFDEWIDVCQKFTAAGIGCFVQGAQLTPFDQDTFQAIANTINPGLYYKAVTGDAKWTDPDLVTALTTWGEMFSNGIMQDGALGINQYPDANNEFLAGKYAMVMMGTWYMQDTRTDIMTAGVQAAGKPDGKPFTIVPIHFPAAVEGGTPGGLFGNSGGGLAVNAKSKNIEAAKTFATWFATSKAGAQAVANLMTNTPAMVGVQPDYDNLGLVDPEVQIPALQWMISESEKVTEPRQLVDPDLAAAVATALTTIASGDVAPEQAAQTLQQTAEGLGITFK